MAEDLDLLALEYHRASPAGKLSVVPTKPMETQHDLALAYSPGVAAACMAIHEDPGEAAFLTGRANLVAVVTNGTAVLGLGNIGPLAAKPVMEGKGALFKKFAGIDVFDIEIDATDPERIIEVVAALEPTFGGINLEDIKAPECFVIEEALRERMRIPVFHDDQHGTAIIVTTAITNGLDLVGKKIEEARIVTSGAGASAIACLKLLLELGARRENIILCDSKGVVHEGRIDEVGPYKAAFVSATGARTLEEALRGADVFLGLSAPGVVTGETIRTMAECPLVLALANPVPEIMPEEVRAVRDDAIIATGRSDYPNQVNNVLGFPFIFRGALDVGASAINEDMKIACVRALARIARSEPSDEVVEAYGGQPPTFGPDYIIPRPFDPRLVIEVPVAVAKAAMDSGVATRPIGDLEAYRTRLSQMVFRTGAFMRPVFEAARNEPRRVAFAEGEERRVLQAVQQICDFGLARPILIGRPEVVEERIARLGLRIRPGEDFELVNPHMDERYRQYWESYHALRGRYGVSPAAARYEARTNQTVIGAVMVHREEADALICGTDGRYRHHLQVIADVIGRSDGSRPLAGLVAHILPTGTFFICDTHVSENPDAEEIAGMTLLAAREVRRFGLEPRVALLSRSNFGTHHSADAVKMRTALALLRERAPELEVDGEMHADAALSERIRALALPSSTLKGAANLLVTPNVEAGNIASNLLKAVARGSGVSVGPILVGTRWPAHVVTEAVSVRGLVDMCAIASAQARLRGREAGSGAG